MLAFFRRETVLTLSLLLAALSMLLVAPDASYAAYVDWDVLALLFSLMAVVAGLKRCGVFERLSRTLARSARNLRRLTLLLAFSCFFSSMLITNDVALLTLVPLTAALLAGQPGPLLYAVSLETIAANLGSMATPIGNPQNLYLYAHYGMAAGDFVRATLPLTAASLLLVALACLPIRPAPLTAPAKVQANEPAVPAWRPALYGLQFLCCLLAVFKLLPKLACFALVLGSLLVFDRRALRQVDYALLGTFLCFFVFVGNLGRIDSVRQLLTDVVRGQELEAGLLASQVVSNVPAALMLSGFTEDATALMRGVDIGGLGTLIASLASLISFKLYVKTPGARTGRYLAVFTGMNLVFLAILYALAKCGL